MRSEVPGKTWSYTKLKFFPVHCIVLFPLIRIVQKNLNLQKHFVATFIRTWQVCVASSTAILKEQNITTNCLNSAREDNEPRPSRGSLTMSWAISATRWFSYIKYFYPWTSSSSCRSLCACLLRFCYSLDPQSMPCFFLRKPAKEGWKFVSFYNINVVRICLRRNHDVLKPDGSCLTSQL